MAASDGMEPAQPEVEEIQRSVGARLRSAREAQELSLEDVAADLRISAPALAALEQDRFESLGPPVFAKGYLKQYGARLGLDVAELVAAYERAAGKPKIDIAPSKSIRLRDERQITLWVVASTTTRAISTTCTARLSGTSNR